MYFGCLVLIIAHDSGPKIIIEGFKGPSEVINTKNQAKMKQKYQLAANSPVYLYISESS